MFYPIELRHGILKNVRHVAEHRGRWTGLVTYFEIDGETFEYLQELDRKKRHQLADTGKFETNYGNGRAVYVAGKLNFSGIFRVIATHFVQGSTTVSQSSRYWYIFVLAILAIPVIFGAAMVLWLGPEMIRLIFLIFCVMPILAIWPLWLAVEISLARRKVERAENFGASLVG